jgi:2-isopropylmalate synthase
MTNIHFRTPEQRDLPEVGLFKKISKLVNGLTRSTAFCMQPLVGKNAFVHTAKLHKDAIRKDKSSYAWIEPEKIGLKNILDYKNLPENYSDYIVNPQIISATELKHHRHGPGDRYVMIDERFVNDCRMYCIIRKIYGVTENMPGHVDVHRHHVDSLFIFLSCSGSLDGLTVEVILGDEKFKIESPASVFIPSGVRHSYRVISGEGLFINTVLSGTYNESLLELGDQINA